MYSGGGLKDLDVLSRGVQFESRVDEVGVVKRRPKIVGRPLKNSVP